MRCGTVTEPVAPASAGAALVSVRRSGPGGGDVCRGRHARSADDREEHAHQHPATDEGEPLGGFDTGSGQARRAPQRPRRAVCRQRWRASRRQGHRVWLVEHRHLRRVHGRLLRDRVRLDDLRQIRCPAPPPRTPRPAATPWRAPTPWPATTPCPAALPRPVAAPRPAARPGAPARACGASRALTSGGAWNTCSTGTSRNSRFSRNCRAVAMSRTSGACGAGGRSGTSAQCRDRRHLREFRQLVGRGQGALSGSPERRHRRRVQEFHGLLALQGRGVFPERRHLRPRMEGRHVDQRREHCRLRELRHVVG